MCRQGAGRRRWQSGCGQAAGDSRCPRCLSDWSSLRRCWSGVRRCEAAAWARRQWHWGSWLGSSASTAAERGARWACWARRWSCVAIGGTAGSAAGHAPARLRQQTWFGGVGGRGEVSCLASAIGGAPAAASTKGAAQALRRPGCERGSARAAGSRQRAECSAAVGVGLR